MVFQASKLLNLLGEQLISIYNPTQIYLRNYLLNIIFSAVESKDEPYAWEAREFLRKKLIGEEVWFTTEKPPNNNRVYGTVYLGKGMKIIFLFLSKLINYYVDFNTAESMTEALINEGLVTVRREGGRNNAEVARLNELEDAAKAAGKGHWSESASVSRFN